VERKIRAGTGFRLTKWRPWRLGMCFSRLDVRVAKAASQVVRTRKETLFKTMKLEGLKSELRKE